jgi:hypothetical protein
MEDRRSGVQAVLIVFLALSWIFITLRCYTRSVIKVQFGADDIFAVAALVSLFLHSLQFASADSGSSSLFLLHYVDFYSVLPTMVLVAISQKSHRKLFLRACWYVNH